MNPVAISNVHNNLNVVENFTWPGIALSATVDDTVDSASKIVDNNVDDNVHSENNIDTEVLQTADIEHQHLVCETLFDFSK